MKRLRGKPGWKLALWQRFIAGLLSVALTEVADTCAMKSYETPSVLRKVLAAPSVPGLRVAGHLHLWSFEAMFAVAGAINFLLYAIVFYLCLRRWWPRAR